MDILDIFGHFYLNHVSPLWGYFLDFEREFKLIIQRIKVFSLCGFSDPNF